MQRCPSCGRTMPSAATFCAECGAPMHSGKTPAGTPEPPPVDHGADTELENVPVRPPTPTGTQVMRANPMRTPSRQTPPKTGMGGLAAAVQWQQETPPAVADGDLTGQILLGQFHVVKKLGSGGFGSVWLAEQKALDRKVVIKVAHADLAADPQFVERFHREAKILALLDQQHLVKVLNFGDLDNGQLYLIMEWGGARDLSEVIKGGALEPMRATLIAAQICEALEEAHAHGIVHRDMKPANVMLAEKHGREWVKVIDLGIAKLRRNAVGDEGAAALTQVGMVMGTPAYFSPEQASGMTLDGRSDLYSVGVVLYEMLTGRLPVQGRTPLDFIRAHTMEPPTPPSAIGVVLPPALDACVMKALEKDPTHRFQTAAEMRAALEAVLGTVASPPTPHGTVQVPIAQPAQDPPARQGISEMVAPRRRRVSPLVVTVLVAVLVTVVGVGAVWVTRRGGTTTPASTVVATSAPAAVSTVVAPVATPIGTLVVRAPGTQLHVRVGTGEPTGGDARLTSAGGVVTIQPVDLSWNLSLQWAKSAAGATLALAKAESRAVTIDDTPMVPGVPVEVGTKPSRVALVAGAERVVLLVRFTADNTN